jgi:hypothetical protein|tara:strand:- start:1077 stop:1376 length:300 start_codon:yes stop_codon:yes gene_type:complete
MQKKTRSILEELTSANLTQDKENLVLSRASHILDSSINLFGFIRENFDQETAYKLEKKFLTAVKQMDPSKFNNGVSRIKELKRIKETLIIKEGEYNEDE